jgi:transcriptional regulator with XRE-family HTH domain
MLYNLVMEIMAKRLTELRNAKGLAQKDIAEYLGITKSAYGFYEQNRREPSPEIIKKLADYFDVSADYLLGRINKPKW